uniref:Uncharacterized protein n=1 Tax=Arundo donax TaxID=35708 RepID=A0A0A9A8T6_ARUDO
MLWSPFQQQIHFVDKAVRDDPEFTLQGQERCCNVISILS